MTPIVQTTIGRMARIFAIGALGIYLGGTLYSLGAQNADLFHRFGALGVAASILFFTDRLLGIELRRQRAVEKMLHEYGLRFEALSSGIEPRDLPDTGFEIDFLQEEDEFEALRRRAWRIQAGNIALLTIATLQWGFGDLIMESLVV